jgi:hypothetical protein
MRCSVASRKPKLLRINTRGPKHGKCNICGDIGPLTEDHTPPKSCLGITGAELHSLHDTLSNDGRDKWNLPRRFQGGVHFRTLCSRCNNLLGTDYDPALAEMCSQVRTFSQSTLQLPAWLTLDIDPQAVVRSVLGHLSAQGVDRYEKGPLTESLRDYILNSALPPPATMRVYYWLYPHRPQILVRDAAMMSLRFNATFGFWLMKFSPLAFFATIDEPEQPLFDITNFDMFRNDLIGANQRVALRIRPQVKRHWPERPDDDHVLLYGQQATVATPVLR